MNILALAVLILLWRNPYQLQSAGFQLSITACSVILIRNQMQCRSPKEKNVFAQIYAYFREAFFISLCAWTVTAPLVAYHFYWTTPFSAIVGLVFLPIVVLMFFACFLLLFTPLGFGPLELVLQSILKILLKCTNELLKINASLPTFYRALPPLAIAILIFYAWILYSFYFQKRRLFHLKIWIAAIMVLFSGQFRAILQYKSQITILDVGQGTSVYIKLPQNRHLLYDCGSTTPGIARKVILPFLYHQGIQSLDAVIISHCDSDHYSAIPEIAKNIAIKKIIVNQKMYERAPWLHKLCQKNAIHLTIVSDREKLPEFPEITFLYPGKYLKNNPEDNEHSLLAYVKTEGKKILFTGDIGVKSLEQLLDYFSENLDVLQVPHHGGHLPKTHQMLRKYKPQYAFISAQQSFPNPITLKYYEKHKVKLTKTYKHGATEFIFGKKRFFIYFYRRLSARRKSSSIFDEGILRMCKE